MTAVVAVLLCLSAVVRCHAGVLVSPVLVEANGVRAGDEIVITCTELDGREQLLSLSLGMFDQDQSGLVFFLEDEEAQARAAEIIELPRRQVELRPYERKELILRVRSADFASSYLAVFIRSQHGSVSSRLAVLLMLCSAAAEEAVELTDLLVDKHSVALTFHNFGTRHGTAAGVVAAYDGRGVLLNELYLESGRILPNRTRTVHLDLALQPAAVRFVPGEGLGSGLMVSDVSW